MKVKTVKIVKEKNKVYNFHCLPNENYFSNGVLVHNCYKSNTADGKHMTFECFKSILDKFPKYNGHHFLTQIAFGIGDVDASDDLWKMMDYTRQNGIIPNVTINGDRMTPEIVAKIYTYCGAVAVSRYSNKNICYDAVKTLTDTGMDQINIHMLLSEETYDDVCQTLHDIQSDPRLSRLNAIVFLSLKQKGRGKAHHRLDDEKFAYIMAHCLSQNIAFGFDSCGANKCASVMKKLGILDRYEKYIEPCESAAFSSYISIDGVFYPCSFADKEVKGHDLENCSSFIDIWRTYDVAIEREKIISNGRSCPYFNV